MADVSVLSEQLTVVPHDDERYADAILPPSYRLLSLR